MRTRLFIASSKMINVIVCSTECIEEQKEAASGIRYFLLQTDFSFERNIYCFIHSMNASTKTNMIHYDGFIKSYKCHIPSTQLNPA